MSQSPQNDHPLYQQSTREPSDSPPPQPHKRPTEDRPTVTLVLMAINLVIFLAGFVSQEIDAQLFVSGALFPPFVVENGQFYRLLSAMFLHANAGHIFFNMYALYIVGQQIEPIFGRVRFLLIYILGGLGGSVLSLALGDYLIPSVGASGAVFAMFAAEAVHFYQHRHLYRNIQGQLRQLVFLIGINLAIGFIPGSRIDNWGHIGGLIGGAILAWRIAPRLQRPTFQITSMKALAQTDTNPLSYHMPAVVAYSFGLIAIFVLAVNLLAP